MGGYIVKWWDIWWFIDGLAAHGWAATMVIIYHHLNFDDPIHLIHPRVSYSIEPQQLLGIHGVIDCQWGSKRRSPRPRRAWRAWSPRWGAPGPVSWFFHRFGSMFHAARLQEMGWIWGDPSPELWRQDAERLLQGLWCAGSWAQNFNQTAGRAKETRPFGPESPHLEGANILPAVFYRWPAASARVLLEAMAYSLVCLNDDLGSTNLGDSILVTRKQQEYAEWQNGPKWLGIDAPNINIYHIVRMTSDTVFFWVTSTLASLVWTSFSLIATCIYVPTIMLYVERPASFWMAVRRFNVGLSEG